MSTPGKTYTLDFFMNRVADTRHFGEGRTYLGSAAVTTGATGVERFTAVLRCGSGGQLRGGGLRWTTWGTQASSRRRFRGTTRTATDLQPLGNGGVGDRREQRRGDRPGPVCEGGQAQPQGPLPGSGRHGGVRCASGDTRARGQFLRHRSEFARDNPDGLPGIALRIDPNGDAGIPPQPFPNIWTDFDLVKKVYYGTPQERAHPSNAALHSGGEAARVPLLHLRRAVGDDRQGTAELRQSPRYRVKDLMVTFGGWTRLITQAEQAGTLMHELGHTARPPSRRRR